MRDKYIFIKRKFLSQRYCDNFISKLEKSANSYDNDRGYYCLDGEFDSKVIEYHPLKNFLLNALDEYVQKHCFLGKDDNTPGLDTRFMIKRFLPGQYYGCKRGFVGYATEPRLAEHCEQGWSEYDSRRLLAWMVYLNDIKKDGGTCWPQQKFTSRPRAGDLYIWPAGWTHSHYGVPAPKENKYFISGWYSYAKR